MPTKGEEERKGEKKEKGEKRKEKEKVTGPTFSGGWEEDSRS